MQRWCLTGLVLAIIEESISRCVNDAVVTLAYLSVLASCVPDMLHQQLLGEDTATRVDGDLFAFLLP